LAPHVPLAYLVARSAVARARRGEVPDWGRAGARKATRASDRPLRTFASPARAQTWFEWRQHGRSLPIWVAILLPFELILLFAVGQSTALVFEILFIAMGTPVLMGALVAATVRKPVSSFLTT